MPKRKAKKKDAVNIKIEGAGKLISKAKKQGKPSMCKPSGTCGGCFYFLGFLGAVIYYIMTATGFWNGVLGFLKALVWPAFLVFELLKYIGA